MLSHSHVRLCDLINYSPPGSSVHGNSPGKTTGVGHHTLLQGIFPTQESNPGLPCCRQIFYWLNHQGSPRILEWVAYPFSRGIFPTQESNWGLLHCRWILYQLSYLGSPFQLLSFVKRSQSPLKKWLILGLSQEKNKLILDCLLYQKVWKETGPGWQSRRMCTCLFLPEHQNHN